MPELSRCCPWICAIAYQNTCICVPKTMDRNVRLKEFWKSILFIMNTKRIQESLLFLVINKRYNLNI